MTFELMTTSERLEHLQGDIELAYEEAQNAADIHRGCDQQMHASIGVLARALWHVKALQRRWDCPAQEPPHA